MLHVEKDATRSCGLGIEIGAPDHRRTASATRITLEPGKVEQGLLKLVLSLVELLRQVMEKQAMRRVDEGSLSAKEIDCLGQSLMQLEATIGELQDQFGIDDLNIELGPLGSLLD